MGWGCLWSVPGLLGELGLSVECIRAARWVGLSVECIRAAR